MYNLTYNKDQLNSPIGPVRSGTGGLRHAIEWGYGMWLGSTRKGRGLDVLDALTFFAFLLCKLLSTLDSLFII